MGPLLRKIEFSHINWQTLDTLLGSNYHVRAKRGGGEMFIKSGRLWAIFWSLRNSLWERYSWHHEILSMVQYILTSALALWRIEVFLCPKYTFVKIDQSIRTVLFIFIDPELCNVTSPFLYNTFASLTWTWSLCRNVSK